MTDPAPDLSYRQAFDRLTAPGSPLELQTVTGPFGPERRFAHAPPNLGSLLDRAEAYGERTCFHHGAASMTYRAFVAAARKVAAGLLAHAEKGDRVAILGANHPDWMLAFWGALYAGLVPAPLNGWWRRQELEHAIAYTRPKLLIGDAKRLAKLQIPETGPLPAEHVFCWDRPDAHPRFLPFSVLQEAVPAGPDPVSSEDLAALIFTSGTTGKAKAAAITHGAWISGLMNGLLALMIEVTRRPGLQAQSDVVTVLSGLPFFHVGGGHGLVIGGIAGGQVLVIPDGRFSPPETLRLIEAYRVERWSAVPAMVQQVCHYGNPEGRDLSSLLTLGYGAAPSGPALQQSAEALFPNLRAITNAYGMTEASSVFTMNTGEDLKQRPDSVGRPFATAQLRVVDEAGTPLPTGETGEVQVRGPFLMREYWEAPEATAAAFAPGGWLRTGDLGRLDAEGFLYLSGRQKDIIIRGGENILAEEVERCLEDHPGILEAAVIGVPSETLGEELKAVLVTGGPDVPDDLAVREWVGRSLAHFKVPRYVEFRDAPLPRNAAGKILKKELAARGTSQFDEML